MGRAWPGRRVEVRRAVAEGDRVVRHGLQRWPGDQNDAAIDILRLDAQGRIMELGDVVQILPEASASPNGLLRVLSVVLTYPTREASHSTGTKS